jgi:nucleoid DNA-binding protein
MFEILQRYLIQRRAVHLPGIGHFRLLESPASYSPADQVMNPPVTRVEKTDEQPPAQKDFFDYISRQLGVEELEAIQQFNSFLFDVRQQLKAGKSIEWPLIGVLTAGEDQSEVVLLPFQNISSLLQPVPATRIVRKEEAHSLKVGEEVTDNLTMTERMEQTTAHFAARWWWWALAFTIASAILIFLQFSQGNSGYFFGNKSLISP